MSLRERFFYALGYAVGMVRAVVWILSGRGERLRQKIDELEGQ